MELAEDIREDLIKRTALEFLGDEPNVIEQFNIDIIKPRPPAPAPPILFEVLDILYNNSKIFYEVFATIVIALGTYFLGRRASKKDQEEMVSKIREILEEKSGQIENQIKANKKLQSKLRWNVGWQIQRLVNQEYKLRWEIRLKVYAERSKQLLDTEKSAKTIINIIMRNK